MAILFGALLFILGNVQAKPLATRELEELGGGWNPYSKFEREMGRNGKEVGTTAAKEEGGGNPERTDERTDAVDDDPKAAKSRDPDRIWKRHVQNGRHLFRLV